MTKRNHSRFKGKKKVASKLPTALLAMIPLSIYPQCANAQVSIVVSGTVELNFGEMAAGAGVGTVTIAPGGARTSTGSVTLLAGAGLQSAAVLSISGSTGLLIDVSVTNTTFTVDDPGAGAPMNVNAFDINGGGPNVASLTITTNPGTFPMGATLNVAGGQGQGAYSGNYTVIANYQ